MKNEFMIEAKRAMYRLRNLQFCHVKMREKSDARLRVAQERHALEISRAEMVEAKGWTELMSITGMTIPTAAAILKVSESTVSRWVARHGEEVALALAVSEKLLLQVTLSGELPCRRIGRLVRYTQADLDSFVEHCDQRGYSVGSRTG